MNQIFEWLQTSNTIQLVDIVIAIAIILLFRLSSNSIAYSIIKMFRLKTKNPNKIKENAFYQPLITFTRIVGIYIAIIFLQRKFNFDQTITEYVKRAFVIISTLAFAKGLAASFTPESTMVRKIQERLNKELEDSMLLFLLKIVRGLIYAIAGFIVITELGFNLNGLVAGLGIGGVIVTLAAQDTAKNLFGGVVLFLDKPFVVGDWIAFDSFEGTVEDITFRSTRLRTFENSIVNIPNSVIASASVTNWSKMEKRRYRANLCLELNTPLEKLEIFKKKVHQMLQSNDTVLDDSIVVRFDEIVENGLNVLICSYTNSVDYPSYLEEREKINCKIMKILKEENIELAYDTKTIYMKQEG